MRIRLKSTVTFDSCLYFLLKYRSNSMGNSIWSKIEKTKSQSTLHLATNDKPVKCFYQVDFETKQLLFTRNKQTRNITLLCFLKRTKINKINK